jgi:hypothetical protein
MDLDGPIYAGISGIELPVDAFDLGEGITLSKTFAHLMCPFLVAFSPPDKPGSHHPPPLAAANGGFGFDISVQLSLPAEFDTVDWLDRLNSLWLFISLIRILSCPNAMVPIVANQPFAKGKEGKLSITFYPMETDPKLLFHTKGNFIGESDLEWLKNHWRAAGRLMLQSKPLSLLIEAFDQCRFVKHPSLALLMLWGALESMFSPSKAELRFRVSANIAAFLEPPGLPRLALQKALAKLYDVRSAVAHGADKASADSLQQTYSLSRRAILKMLDANHVPSQDELAASLFGG